MRRLGPLELVALASASSLIGVWIGCLVTLAGLGSLSSSTDVWASGLWIWDNRSAPQVRAWLMIGAASGAGAAFVLAGTVLKRPRPPLHGSARLATEADVRREGFRNIYGVILGKKNGRLLVFGGPEHVLLYAPTRSGKGVGVVIPNLLSWSGSLVVLDIKRENWAASAGFRAAHGQQVTCFDPLDPEGRTARYNPLGHIDRDDPIAVLDELQRIAVMLFPSPDRIDPFWAEAARTGFIGVGALIAATPATPFTFGEIYRLMTAADLRNRLSECLRRRRAETPGLSIGAAAALTDFCSASENTFAGIKQTITARLNLWLNPRVVAATEASDFDLRQIRDRPMAVYLCTSPDNLDRVAPLYGLLFQQLIDLNTRSLPSNGRHQVPVLVLLDEFARLGQASVLAHAFSYVAGYGLRLLPVLQSPAQLRLVYGAELAEDIMANCGAEIVFAPKELKVARELSQRLGTYTFEGRARSRPVGLSPGARSMTVTDQPRPLMLPQELLQMPRDRLLVFRAGMAPISGHKLRYFRESAFRRRVSPPPTVVSLSARDSVLVEPAQRLPADPVAPSVASSASDPLTIGMPPLKAEASEEELVAWVEMVIDAGVVPQERVERSRSPKNG